MFKNMFKIKKIYLKKKIIKYFSLEVQFMYQCQTSLHFHISKTQRNIMYQYLHIFLQIDINELPFLYIFI